MNTVLLSAIVTATAGGGFVYADPNGVLPLVEAGYAETNPALVDENGAIAARSTDAGAAYLASMATQSQPQVQTGFGQAPATTTAPTATTSAPASAPSSFVRASFVPPVKARKPREGGEKYPFGDLVAPNPETKASDAFFVPATAAMPDPVKSLASAVSAANRRYATVTGSEVMKDKDGNPMKDEAGKEKTRNVYKYNRRFEVFAGTADHTPNGQPGAWVARTE